MNAGPKFLATLLLGFGLGYPLNLGELFMVDGLRILVVCLLFLSPVFVWAVRATGEDDCIQSTLLQYARMASLWCCALLFLAGIAFCLAETNMFPLEIGKLISSGLAGSAFLCSLLLLAVIFVETKNPKETRLNN